MLSIVDSELDPVPNAARKVFALQIERAGEPLHAPAAQELGFQ